MLPPSEFRTAAMLALLMEKNYEVRQQSALNRSDPNQFIEHTSSG